MKELSKRKFLVSVLPGSGIKMIVAPSYNDLSETIKSKVSEDQFTIKYHGKNPLIIPVKTYIDLEHNYIAVIAEKNYDELREHFFGKRN